MFRETVNKVRSGAKHTKLEGFICDMDRPVRSVLRVILTALLLTLAICAFMGLVALVQVFFGHAVTVFLLIFLMSLVVAILYASNRK